MKLIYEHEIPNNRIESPDSSVVTVIDEDLATVSVSGQFDAYFSPFFSSAVDSLLNSKEDFVTARFDLHKVCFADSTALYAIIKSTNKLREVGKATHIYKPTYPVKRLLEITDLIDKFEIVESETLP